MTSIMIRDVPPDVHATLVARAETEGRSMQQYMLRLVVESARRRTQQEVLDDICRRAEGFPPISVQSIVDDVRASREQREAHLLKATS